jgi:hypothetical protein
VHNNAHPDIQSIRGAYNHHAFDTHFPPNSRFRSGNRTCLAGDIDFLARIGCPLGSYRCRNQSDPGDNTARQAMSIRTLVDKSRRWGNPQFLLGRTYLLDHSGFLEHNYMYRNPHFQRDNTARQAMSIRTLVDR